MWRDIMEKVDGIAKEDMKLGYLAGAKNTLEQVLKECLKAALNSCIENIKNLEQKNDIEDDTKKDWGVMYLTGKTDALCFMMEEVETIIERVEHILDENEYEQRGLDWINDIDDIEDDSWDMEDGNEK